MQRIPRMGGSIGITDTNFRPYSWQDHLRTFEIYGRLAKVSCCLLEGCSVFGIRLLEGCSVHWNTNVQLPSSSRLGRFPNIPMQNI